MKYASIRNTVSCIACIIIVAVFAFTLAGREKNISPPSSSEAATSQQNMVVDDAATYDYLIKSYEGKIAVFLSGGAQKPEMVLNVYVHLLPEYDRSLLEAGVPVKDYAALVVLLEDYTS